MCDFKIGDKVILVRIEKDEEKFKKYSENLGKVFTIKKINKSKIHSWSYVELEETEEIIPCISDLEKIQTKEDLDIELCKYCEFEKPFDSLGNCCEGCRCDEAYETYKREILGIYENNESEEFKMEILDIYRNRKLEKISSDHIKKQEEIRKNDIFAKLASEYNSQVKALFKNEFNEEYTLGDISPKVESFETKQKLEKAYIEFINEEEKLGETIQEVKAQLEIAENYETKIKILKNYNILNKEGKINAGDVEKKK